MIKAREEIDGAERPFIVDKKLFLEIARGELAALADKFAKPFVLLDDGQMEAFRKQYAISELRKRVGKLGGRPRLPDLTEEQLSLLPKEERQKYRMRIWKRNSRQRSRNEQTNT